MALPSGYPNHPLTYWLGIITYLLTLLVSVALLLLLRSQKNKIQDSTKKIINSVIRCLLYSLIRSLSWLISNIALIIMVYQPSNSSNYALNLVSVISGAFGYAFQFMYVSEVGYFLKENLIYLCEDTTVKIKTCGVIVWWLLWLIYVISALLFNIFFIVSDDFDYHTYDYIENITSWGWFIVSFLYNVLILIIFNLKLHKLCHPDYSKKFNHQIVNLFTKQATLMSFMVISMIIYITATHIWFHLSLNSLTYWHIVYLFTQSIVLFSAFLTFNFDSNSDFYLKFCKCCDNICRKLCIKCTCKKVTFVPLNDESDTDVQFLQMGQLNEEINSKVDKLCLLLEMYNKNEDINEKNYNVATILDDFNYILEHYDSEQNFNKIHNRLTSNNKHSHYKQCKVYSRYNSRRRERIISSRKPHIEMKVEAHTKPQSELTMILDKIHSFYYHSYDTFLRKKYFSSDDESDKKEKQSLLVDDIIDFENNKFSSNLNENDNDNIYGFGERFEYSNQDTKDNNSNIICIKKKYKDFQEELLQNTYKNCCISKFEYEQEFIKCIRNMQLERTKKLQSRNKQETLLTEYILALQIYCNFDVYQKAWTETFRRLKVPARSRSIPENFKKVAAEHNFCDDSYDDKKYNQTELNRRNSKHEYESIPSLIARHENFYWSSKYLLTLIECFGERLIDDKNRRIDKTFWRGVIKILYPKSTIAQFNGPLSTSEEQTVAHTFSGGMGMILALRYSYSTDPFNAKYFDCKYYSDYANEKECLFIGGKPMMIITNIIQFMNDTLCSYKTYINAINIINCLLNGTINGSDMIRINDKSVDICCDLLSSQMLKQSDNLMNLSEITHIPEYVLHLAFQYCINLNNIIIFWNGWKRFGNIEKLKKLLCGNVNLAFFDLDVLLQLFPNIEQIEYSNESLTQSISFSRKSNNMNSDNMVIKEIVDYIVNYTKKDTQLKHIIIHHKLLNISEYNETDTDWKIKLVDEKVILSRKNVDVNPNEYLPERQRGLSAGTLLKKMSTI